MEVGVVCFQNVGEWRLLECQRHICEIQGLFATPQLTNLIRKPTLS